MGHHWDHQSYYEILEVPRDAHESEIRIAYHRARETYNKDNVALLSVFTPEEAEALLQLVEEAYSILSHPESRRAYDQKLLRERGENVERHAAEFFLTQDSAEFSTPEPLPEFVFKEEASVPSRPAPASRHSESPRREGKTPISSYEVDPAIEETIRSEEMFSGDFLRLVREYKNIDIDQITDYTRIGKDYLNALEREDFDTLPAPVFVRGFLIQLARLYKLDEAKLCKAYLDRLKAYKK
jgi:curved DNA-binding protein CbpA